MDTKEAIKTLLKITQSQQKMIEKLAQMQHVPQRLEPGFPELHPSDVVMAHLPPQVKAAVQGIAAKGNVLEVSFKPGMATQAALDMIVKVVQQLVAKNLLPFPYSIRAV